MERQRIWFHFISVTHCLCDSQQSMKHTGKRRDPYPTGHTQTDVIVEHLLRWASKWAVHIKSAHTHKNHRWNTAKKQREEQTRLSHGMKHI